MPTIRLQGQKDAEHGKVVVGLLRVYSGNGQRLITRNRSHGSIHNFRRVRSLASTSAWVWEDKFPRCRTTSDWWMVANLCRPSSESIFRPVLACCGWEGSSTMSVGSSGPGGMTEVMYATKTSGTEPKGPVSSSTGRSFVPTLPPKGKWARWISPGFIFRFPVLEGVNI